MQQCQTGIMKKPQEQKSEDIIGSNNGFFWLLDGATPPAEKKNKELTQQFLNVFNVALSTYSLECTTTKSLFEKSMIRVRDIFKEKYDLDSFEYLPYSTAVIFKIDNEIEYTVLSDSYLVIQTKNKAITITDNRLNQIAVKERNLVCEMIQNDIDEKSTEYIQARKNLIYNEMKFQNTPNGYWVAGLNPFVAKEAISGTVAINKDEEFLVFAFSDGLARLVTHLGKFKDFYALAEAIVQNGGTFIFNKLRELEADKLNFVKPVASNHDDASFILISNNQYKKKDDMNE